MQSRYSATGTFTVKLHPQPLFDESADPLLARLSLDKQFHGELEASSKGEMLSAHTNTKGSASYVAIEKVDGVLNGRKGSFVLQHTGRMYRNTPFLSVVIVPDSGTDELTGISGTMTIEIVSSKHLYTIEYAFDDE